MRKTLSFARKGLSILCAAALLLLLTLQGGRPAAADAGKVYGFEDYALGNSLTSGSGLALESGEGVDGGQALSFIGYATPGSPRLAMVREGTDKAAIEAGKMYEIAWRYKLVTVPAKRVDFVVYATSATNVTGDGVRTKQDIASQKTFENTTPPDSEWQTYTTRFTAKADHATDKNVAIGYNCPDGGTEGMKLLVDNVTIQEVTVTPVPDGAYSFEPGTVLDNGKKSNNVSFDTVNVHGGLQSVKFGDFNTNHAASRLVQVRDGSKAMTLTDGTAYRMSWWYKVDALSHAATLQVTAAGANVYSGNFKAQTLTPVGGTASLALAKGAATDGWVKCEVLFTASLASVDKNVAAIGLVLTNPPTEGDVTMEIYFDDVTIEEVTVTPPESEAYSFEAGTTLDGNKKSGNVSLNLDPANVHTGTQSVKFGDFSANSTASRLVQVRDGSKVMTLENGAAYTVSWWYKVAALSHDATLQLFATKTDNVNAGAELRKEQALTPASGTSLTLTKDAATDWVKCEVSFTASLAPEANNVVAIGLQADVGGNNDAVVTMEIYFDDVTITKTKDPEPPAVDVPEGTYSFEDYDAAINSACTSYSGIRLSQSEHVHGSQSLEYFNPGSGQSTPRVFMLTEGSRTERVTAGQAYKITFRYKIPQDFASGMKADLVVFTTSPDNVTDGKVRQEQYIVPAVSFASKTDGWATASVSFNARIKEGQPGYTALALGVSANGDIGTSIFFDEIKVETTDPVKEPDPVPEGVYSFETGTTFGNSQKGGNVSLNTVQDNVHTGLQSVKFGNFEKNSTASRLVQVRDGSKVMTLENGATYTVSWWYKVAALSHDATLQLFATKTDNVNAGAELRKEQALTPANGTSLTLTKGTATDWVKCEVSFTASLAPEANNVVAIGLKADVGGNNDTPVTMEIYFDDVTITKTKDPEPKPPAVDVPEGTYSFEDYDAAISSNRTSFSGIRLSKDEHVHGNQSIEYFNPGSGQSTPRVFMLTEGSRTERVTAGQAYKITFRYKIPQDFAPGMKANLVVFTTSPDNVTADPVRLQQYIPQEVTFTSKTDGWATASVSFNARIKEGQPGYTALALGVSANGDIGTSIFFDEIKVETTDPVKEPDPIDPNHAVYDFELFGYDTGSAAMSVTGVSISGDHARSGSHAAKYVISEEAGNPTTLRVLTPNGVTSEKRDNRFRMTEKGVYLVRFWYYLEEAPSDEITVSLWSTNSAAMAVDSRMQLQASRTLVLDAKAATGKWVEFTAAVYAEFVNENAANNYLTMGFQLATSTVSDNGLYEPAVYIDDFEVETLDPDQVHLVLKSDVGPTHISGRAGAPLSLPSDLTRDGYAFGGWFSDDLFETPFAEDTFTANGTVAAKWIRRRLGQGFEDYPYTGAGHGYDLDIEVYGKDTPGFNAANVYEGGVSIHRIGNMPYAKRFILMNRGSEQLTPGETYTLTFYVKLESTTAVGQLPLEVMPMRMPDKTVANDGVYEEILNLRDLEPGFWYKATVQINAMDRYLALRTPGETSVFFDGFSMEWLAPDEEAPAYEALVKLGTGAPGTPVTKPDGTPVTNPDGTPVTNPTERPGGAETGGTTYAGWCALALVPAAGALLATGRRRGRARRG